MNKILCEIKNIIKYNIKEYLPDVKENDLEENGLVYYMNGKDGTEFDWYVNEKLPSFMVFYNDEKNLGAAKLLISANGSVDLYLYGDKGETRIKQIKTNMDVSEEEIFKLAVILKNEADEKRIWDRSLEEINSDVEISEDKINEFKNNEVNYEQIIKRFKLFDLSAIVSKKIVDEGWKVGYMYIEEPSSEKDSGWVFMAGDEDEEYRKVPENYFKLSLYEIYKLDSDIWNYIDSPIGSEFIRISSNEFEKDNQEKEIYMEKREG